MQFKQTLFIAALSAAGVMGQDNSLASNLASLTSDLASLTAAFPTSELSIFSVLATAVPSSLLTAINDPAVQSSLNNDFKAGNTPSWYSALPADVKSYINGVESETSNVPLTSVASSLSAAVSSIKSSVSSIKSSVSSQVSAASQSVAGSSTSKAGAPAPTAAIVASMAGAIGVLALAVGL